MATSSESAQARPLLPPDASTFAEAPAESYLSVRDATRRLCDPLQVEDFGLQSMECASPPKWHLAHTTWFFETFVLEPASPGYEPFHPTFGYLFNSYYETVGRMHPRPKRGLLSRPTVAEVMAYREHVDERVSRLLQRGALDPQRLAVVELGLHHEQQHQELLLTDLKHGFSCNALFPEYRNRRYEPGRDAGPMRWVEHHGGVARIGHRSDAFTFDNEGPPHRVFLEPYALSSRLVTCAEYMEFMADGGYERPELWLSRGWEQVQRDGWQAPLYWHRRDEHWKIFTLDGMRDVDPHEPVSHVSLYEADAYARWTGYRLPSEFEWEVACAELPIEGNFAESQVLHPSVAPNTDGLTQAYGDLWEWTGSAYAPYPAYRTPEGALGEYNGKFMCSQLVLRGGSCATPRSHMRATYRNFFYPEDRWQFSGIRLARDL